MNIEDISEAPWFTVKDQKLTCKVIDVYDGDTITIIFPFAGGYYKDKLRLYGIDTPELRTKNADEKKAGLEARDWLRDRILYKKVDITFYGKDKYGRLMGEIYDTENVNQLLVKNDLAYEYNGGKKKKYIQDKQ